MKVDMSPDAVTQRLRLQEELWVLSMALMNSKPIAATPQHERGEASKHPITPAVRFLRENKVEFTPHLYDYVEKGGARESARQLGIDIHAVVKTLVFETNEKKPLIVLMHGDREVSTKNLARHVGVKSIEPASPERVTKLTGYIVGGTSPFGTRTVMPVYAEKTIFELDKIYINGGKRGFLVEINPRVLQDVLRVGHVELGI
jgi:Cys-tRNA(Pro) deacylase